MDIHLDVVGVRVEMPSQQPVVLLRETDGIRYVPIWVGAAEASSIAFAASGVIPPRPLTHDLMCDLLSALGTELSAVRITDLRDGVFYAELVLQGPSGTMNVGARPSDAIALAMRMGAPISSSAEVMDQASIEIADDQDAEDSDPEETVQEFREFLEHISPEDFQ